MPTPETTATAPRPKGSHLPPETQVELARAALGGSTEARDILLETNMGLLRKIVTDSEARKRGIDADDLMQEACMGFLRGLELYDPDSGVHVVSYAGIHARSYVQRYAENKGRTIRLPIGAQRVMWQAKGARVRLGQDASDDDVAADIGTSTERLEVCDRAARVMAVSLSSLVGANHPDLLIEGFVADQRAALQFEAVDRAAHLDSMAELAHLTEQEHHVIRRLWLDDIPQSDIAKEMVGRESTERGVSRQRVGQIKKAAIKKLRSAASIIAGKIVA